MQKENLLYEGKTKRIYATEGPACYIVDYKDDVTTFNGLEKGTIVDRGVVSNCMSNFMFQMLEKDGILTHFVKELSGREVLVKKVEIAPPRVVVRNKAAGNLAKRFGLGEGTPMRAPVLEFCYKNDELSNPMVNEYHILATDSATREEIDVISKMTLRINELMCEFFRSMNIELIDFELEFGHCGSKIILTDEISPDTYRFWSTHTHEKLDEDRFCRDLGGVEEAYAEMMRRISL